MLRVKRIDDFPELGVHDGIVVRLPEPGNYPTKYIPLPVPGLTPSGQPFSADTEGWGGTMT